MKKQSLHSVFHVGDRLSCVFLPPQRCREAGTVPEFSKPLKNLESHKKSEAIDKIKSILRYTLKDKANLLADRTQFNQVINQERSSNNLSDLQNALTNYKLVKMQYINKEGSATNRLIEPFAILSSENWYLVAWCRLRKEFRFFRLDRIQKMEILSETFEPHNLTLQAYFDRYH